jgi:hypothetical protein
MNNNKEQSNRYGMITLLFEGDIMDTIVIERIKRKIESGMCITPRSTPVIWFGDYDHAKACTISLNPSDIEFYKHPRNQEDYSKPENLLTGRHERLCSRMTLTKDDGEELTGANADMVKKQCTKYFETNPHKRWFNPFDVFIKRFGAYSYYDNTCVHLDLVQWATTPKWSEVPDALKQKHLDNDLPVLKHLLKKNFEVMFLNGQTVVENIEKCLDLRLEHKTADFKKKDGGNTTIHIFYGAYKKTKVIGWSAYLQSKLVGGYENIGSLCDVIKNV